MLGASGDPEVPGLGFRFDEDERWSTPNSTGREGVFEAYCPPHYPDMRSGGRGLRRAQVRPGRAVQRARRGLERQPRRARPPRHDEEFKACVALQAQYVFDTLRQVPRHGPDA